ncbi:MAG: tyrosine-type recombinase/integrase [Muribaculaceae bacterium]
MTIEGFLKYLRYELNYSVHTVLSYKNDLNQFSKYLVGGGNEPLRLQDVTQSDIRAWMLSRSQAGDCTRTIRRKVQSLRTFYKYLQRMGEVEDNPALNVELAKVGKKLPTFVRTESMNSLIDEAIDESDFEEVRNKLIVVMLYETGIRRGELIDLLDANVDVEKQEMKVHGKRDKDRIVPMCDELCSWVTLYRHLRALQVDGGNSPQFFVRANGKPVYASLVYNVVHKALMTTGGTNKYSPHVLRHSFASAMLNAGAEINNVKELLGHESLAATQVYTHITFRELKDNYQSAHPRALKKGGHHGN